MPSPEPCANVLVPVVHSPSSVAVPAVLLMPLEFTEITYFPLSNVGTIHWAIVPPASSVGAAEGVIA